MGRWQLCESWKFSPSLNLDLVGWRQIMIFYPGLNPSRHPQLRIHPSPLLITPLHHLQLFSCASSMKYYHCDLWDCQSGFKSFKLLLSFWLKWFWLSLNCCMLSWEIIVITELIMVFFYLIDDLHSSIMVVWEVKEPLCQLNPHL